MNELEDCLQQVYRMALASLQSYVFWLRTQADSSAYEETLKKFGHFFYATNEAHITTLIISLDAIYDEKPKLMNFGRLLTLASEKLKREDHEKTAAQVEELRQKAKGIGIVRNNSFGHVAAFETRMKMGEKYAPSHKELLDLCYGSLAVASNLVRLLGGTVPSTEEVMSQSIDQIEAMLEKLQEGK